MKTLIRNIGQLVSGDIRRPLVDADSLLIRNGVIAAIGRGLDEAADTVIDARGTTVMPGLIDSHVHPVFGDFTPRQPDAFAALTAGDLPGISMVLIDGKITIGRSCNTPPAARAAEVLKGEGPGGSGH